MAANRRNSRQGSRTTGNARSGKKKGKQKHHSTTPRRKRRQVLTSEERKMLVMLENRKYKTDHVEEVIAAVKPDFTISGPFWSSGYRAYRLEYSEREGEKWWQSSFFCSRGEDAQRLGEEARRRVQCRQDWLALREQARKIASENGDAVIYRTMLGEASEGFR